MNSFITSFVKSNRLLLSAARKIQFRLKNKQFLKGNNNRIKNKGKVLNVKFTIIGNNNLIEIEDTVILVNTTIDIKGNNHKIIIRKKSICKGGAFCLEDNNCEIIIGENSSIESAHMAVTEPGRKILIGKDCMISHGVVLRTGDSHSIIDYSTKERINPAKNIEIGDHVWIGADTKILKGVIIEHNSIIATGAIVTHNIPPNSIATGIPAKVIKSNIDWLRER